MRVVLEIGDWILVEDDDGEVRLWNNRSTGETRTYEDIPIEVETHLRENDVDRSSNGGETLELAVSSPLRHPVPETLSETSQVANNQPTPFTRQRGVAAISKNSALSEPLLDPLQSVSDTKVPDSVPRMYSNEDMFAQVEPISETSRPDLSGLDVADRMGDQERVGEGLAETTDEIVCVESQEPAPEIPSPANLPSVPEREATPAMLVNATSMRKHQGQSQQQFLATLTHLHLGRKGLTSLGSAPQLCARLKVLNLEGNHLQEILGLRPNCSFEVLHLQGNDIWNLGTWTQNLPSLRTLDLADNRLILFSGLEKSRCLEELNLRGQKSNLPLQFHPPTLRIFSRSLRSLDIARNRITDISPIVVLSSLERLDASSNMLVDITHIGDVLPKISRLSRLNLSENPVVLSFKYRDMVILAASERLVELDEKSVQQHERAFLVKLHQQRERKSVEPGVRRRRSPSPRRSSSLVPLPPEDHVVAPPPGQLCGPISNRSRSSSRDPSGRQYRRKSSGPARLPPLPPRIGV